MHANESDNVFNFVFIETVKKEISWETNTQINTQE